MQCPKCYQMVNDSVSKCPNCGEVMVAPRPASMPPPPIPKVLPPPNLSALRSGAPPIQINSLDDITPQTLPYIQQAVKHLSLAAPGVGIFNILFGLFITVVGVVAFNVNPINAIQVILGLALVILGIWSVANKPTVALFKFDAILYFAYGAWRIIVGLINMSDPSGSTNAVRSLLFGGFMVYLGFLRMKAAGEFENLQKLAPHEVTIKCLREMLKIITKSGTPGVIFFSLTEFTTTSVWKMQLGAQYSMAVNTRTGEAIVNSRDQVNFVPEVSTKPKKTYKAAFTIGEKQFKGTIKAEQLAKYQSWKLGAVVPAVGVV